MIICQTKMDATGINADAERADERHRSANGDRAAADDPPRGDDDRREISRAAEALRRANYLLVAAGAGFSADSGLSTYETFPEEYRDMCDPIALLLDERRFQTYWSDFGKTYDRTEAHDGYRILNDWCSGGKLEGLKRRRSSSSSSSASPPWWAYTSNIDGHFRRYDSFRESVCEIHGFAGEFRCAARMGYSYDDDGTGAVARRGEDWDRWNALAKSVRTEDCFGYSCPAFAIESDDHSEGGEKKKDETTIIRRCRHCRLPMRPNVLLFNDTDQTVLGSIAEERERYQDWEARMERDLESSRSRRLAILELGCGANVPAVRHESEEVLRDCLKRITAADDEKDDDDEGRGRVTLVRINPKDADWPCGNEELSEELLGRMRENTVMIRDTALRALTLIDALI